MPNIPTSFLFGEKAITNLNQGLIKISQMDWGTGAGGIVFTSSDSILQICCKVEQKLSQQHLKTAHLLFPGLVCFHKRDSSERLLFSAWSLSLGLLGMGVNSRSHLQRMNEFRFAFWDLQETRYGKTSFPFLPCYRHCHSASQRLLCRVANSPCKPVGMRSVYVWVFFFPFAV